MATGAVRVSGLRELQTAFRKIGGSVNKELRDELKDAADPVKVRAQSLALTQISNMPRSPRWADMRIGVSARGVYMVPRARRRGGSGRPNLKGLLLDQSMDPALMEKQDEIVQSVEKMFDNLAGRNGF